MSELNRFVWPGPDLWLRERGDAASVTYGELPAALFREVLRKLEAALVARFTRTTTRSS